MKRLSVCLVAFGVLASCGTEPERALRVTVTIKASGDRRVRADCLKLSVLDGNGELKSVVVSRPSDDVAIIGVRQGADLPRAVRLQVQGMLGTCTDVGSLRLNAQADPVAAEFPESGVTPIDLTLEPPGASLDADGDGYVAVDKGGVDCRDTGPGAATVFPGAGQVCDVYEDTDCDGARGCDDTKCTASPVCANPGDRFVVTSAPAITEMLRYECVGPFTVTLQNAQGPRAAVRDMQVALSASLAGTSVHALTGCGDAPVTSYALNYGQTSFQVYLKADGAALGATTLRASAQGVMTAGTANVQVRPQPIAQLRFGPPIAAVTAGTCSTEQVTLEFVDSLGRPTVVESVASILLSSSPSQGTSLYFSDAACTSSVTTAPVPAGQGTVRLHVSSERAGAVTMTATPSTGQASATQVLQVQPAAAHTLAFANQPLAVTSTQSCSSGELTIELRDRFDNTITPVNDVEVEVTSSLSDLSFRPGTDTTCSTAAESRFTIAAGATSVRARVRPGAAGSGMVTAAATTLANVASATQVIDVAGGPPTRLALAGTPQSPLAGECSGAPVELRVQDSAGNPSSFPMNVTVTLSATPAPAGTFGFFTTAGCGTTGAMTVTIPSGQSRVQLFFRGTRVASFAIGATMTTPISATAPASMGHSIRANVPGKLVFAAPLTQSVAADLCSGAYNVNILDVHDNPTSFAADQALTVTSMPADVTIGVGAACTGSSVPVMAGAQSASFAANRRLTGTYALTAMVGSISTATPAQLTVTPGPSTLSVTVPSGGAATVQAGDCVPVTLVRRDAYGNNAPTSGSIALTPPGTTGLYAYAGACPTGTSVAGNVTSLTLTNNHTIGFNLKPTLVGSPTMTATLGPQTANVNLTVNPGAPVLQFEAPATGAATLTAGQCVTVTVARKDAFNNDVPLAAGGTLAFGTWPAGVTAHAVGSCGSLELSSVPWPANAARVSFLVRATASGAGQNVQFSLGASALTLALTVNPDAPTLVLVNPAGGTATAAADGCVLGRVERRDQFGNPVNVGGTGANLTFVPTGPVSVFTSSMCALPATTSIPVAASAFGQSFYFKSTVAGLHGLQASLSGQSQNIQLTVNPGPASRLDVLNLPATLAAGDCTTQSLTVRRTDAFNNPVTAEGAISVALSSPMDRLSFSGSAGCAVVGSSANVSISMGSSTSTEPVFVTGTRAGAATVSAASGLLSGQASTTINPGLATRVVFVNNPNPLTVAAGQCTAAMSVELQDQYDNRVTPGSNTTVNLAAAPSTGVTFTRGTSGCAANDTSVVLTAAQPTQSFTMRANPAPSTVIVTASQGALTPGTISWGVEVGPPAALVWKTATNLSLPRFACGEVGTLELRDAGGNTALAAAPVSVTVDSSLLAAGLAFYLDAACTMLVGSGYTIPAGQSEVTVYGAAGGTGATNVTALSTGLADSGARQVTVGGAQGTLGLTPATPTLEAGACLEMTVERRAGGTPTGLGISNVRLQVPGATTAVTLHTEADCASAGGTAVTRLIGAGETTARFYVRGRTGGDNAVTSVTATASELSGAAPDVSTVVSALPLVRRGTCDLTGASRRCVLVPPIPGHDISRSFLVFSATGNPVVFSATGNPVQSSTLRPGDQNVACRLDATATDVAVLCEREGNRQTMAINYQVVSHGRSAAQGGVTVQHFAGDSADAAGNTDITLPVAVTLESSFVLFSSRGGPTSEEDNDGNDFFTARLAGVSTLTLQKVEDGVRSYAAQVVSVAGATVTRNASAVTVAAGSFAANSQGLASVPSARTMLLMHARSATSPGATYMCARRFRAWLQSDTRVDFRRGKGTQSQCDDVAATITWERVTWPACTATTTNLCASVQHPAPRDINGSSTSENVTVTAVDRARAIALSAGQGPGGQCAGESTFYSSDAATGDNTGPLHARLDLTNTTTVAVTRGLGSGDSTFSVQVVEFRP